MHRLFLSFKITLFIKLPVGYKVSRLLRGVKCRSCINANVLEHHALEQKTVTDGNWNAITAGNDNHGDIAYPEQNFKCNADRTQRQQLLIKSVEDLEKV